MPVIGFQVLHQEVPSALDWVVGSSLAVAAVLFGIAATIAAVRSYGR